MLTGGFQQHLCGIAAHIHIHQHNNLSFLPALTGKFRIGRSGIAMRPKRNGQAAVARSSMPCSSTRAALSVIGKLGICGIFAVIKPVVCLSGLFPALPASPVSFLWRHIGGGTLFS